MTPQLVAVIIGNEILAGRRQDKHLANTVAACNARNLRLNQVIILQDNADVLVKTYTRLRAEKAIVLSFGGIGATPDDMTRAAVAKACGVPLVYHPEGYELLRQKYGAADFNEHRRNLIAFPEGASLIPNPINQIPGFSIAHIHCVPGFPAMAEPMMAWVLDTYYQNLAQERDYQALIVQAPESGIASLMAELDREFPSLSISCLPTVDHGLEFGFEGEKEMIAKAMSEAQKRFSALGYASKKK